MEKLMVCIGSCHSNNHQSLFCLRIKAEQPEIKRSSEVEVVRKSARKKSEKGKVVLAPDGDSAAFRAAAGGNVSTFALLMSTKSGCFSSHNDSSI